MSTPLMTVSALDETLTAKILDLLEAGQLMAIATQRPDGYPQTTYVNYVHEGLTLYFATDASAQKIGNIHLNAKVSGAIAIETQNYYRLKGLSFSGVATQVHDKGLADEIVLALFRRTPQSRRFVPEDPLSLAVVRIQPVAISIVDYAQGFGRSTLVEM